jgi:glycosyltransferase involved in cell wall biosynthesis
MKIAFLNLYSGINNRGAESFIHELAKRLTKSHEVTLISGGLVDIENVKNLIVVEQAIQQQHGFRSYFDNFLKRVFLDPANLTVLSFSLKALAILRKEKFDVVIPVNGFWQVVICWVAKIITGSKIMITGHSGPGWDERWNLFLSPDVFVATTEPTREWARKTAFWVNSVTIPYGIDPEEFVVEKTKLFLQKPIFLCPAAAVPYKRIDLAIKAVALLESGSLLHLGAGPLVSELEKLGKELLGPNRFQTTSVDHKDVASYNAACDVVVLPSHPQENSPMVFLEALASQKPVVVTDTKRNRWLLGKAGFFVDPTDTNGFSLAIKDALANVKEINFKEELKKFSWETVLSAYESVLSNLIK